MTPQHAPQDEATAVVSDTAAMEDHRLLQHLAQGDTTAFWRIWEHYRETVLARRCLQWMGGNPVEAEDALSSACLKAWQKLPAYAHDIRNVKGWLLQFLHNHCMDIRRAHTRHLHTGEGPDDSATPAVAEPMHAHESPEHAILRRETSRAIQQALAHLPARLREPAILRFCHEFPHRDIAAQLGLTPEATRKRIQQARTLLQEQLRAYLDDTSGSPWRHAEPADVASAPRPRDTIAA